MPVPVSQAFFARGAFQSALCRFWASYPGAAFSHFSTSLFPERFQAPVRSIPLCPWRPAFLHRLPLRAALMPGRSQPRRPARPSAKWVFNWPLQPLPCAAQAQYLLAICPWARKARLRKLLGRANPRWVTTPLCGLHLAAQCALLSLAAKP